MNGVKRKQNNNNKNYYSTINNFVVNKTRRVHRIKTKLGESMVIERKKLYVWSHTGRLHIRVRTIETGVKN